MRVLCAAMLLLIVATSTVSARVLKFRGAPAVDEKKGLTVKSAEGGQQVHIASSRYGFRLAVPYSESWQVRSDKRLLLQASDENHEIAIQRWTAHASGVQDYLAAILKEPPLTAGGIEYRFYFSFPIQVQHPQMLQIEGRIIAAYQMRVPNPPQPLADRDKWRWYCWTINAHYS